MEKHEENELYFVVTERGFSIKKSLFLFYYNIPLIPGFLPPQSILPQLFSYHLHSCYSLAGANFNQIDSSIIR